MGRIYYDFGAIPIPGDAYINHHGSRVFKDVGGNGNRRLRSIGVMTEEGLMLVNENFRREYPQEWEERFGNKIPAMCQVNLGLYAASLSIASQTGIYQVLQEAFGPRNANAILDYAMFCIHERSNVTQHFPDVMKEQMLFSRKPWSDSWYSKLFTEKMTADAIHEFRCLWAKKCAERGFKKVWLCVDGSNNDCDLQDSDLAEKGKAKSHQITEIVSYMWAVDADDGRPITWFENPGGMPDCKAVDSAIRFLSASGMAVEGFIMDRGFVSNDVLELIKSKGLQYVVMLKAGNAGFSEMLKQNADALRWRTKYAVDDEGTFGITGMAKALASSKEESCIGLYFSGEKSFRKIVDLVKKVRRAKKELTLKLAVSPEKAVVPKSLQEYLKIQYIGNGKFRVETNDDAVQKTADSYGWHAIASSKVCSAEEIHRLYKLRDCSEKQFSMLKSQLGGHVTRVHSDAAIKSKFAVEFVASVIRTELLLVCKRLELDTNVMIRRLDRIQAMRMPGGSYEAINNMTDDLKALTRSLGLVYGHFREFANEINIQEVKTVYKQEREIPNVEKPHRGRPRGSKNKKTLEREARERAQGKAEEPKVKRKPGRPKGSKNKATLIREAEAAAKAPEQKRRPGRPKGSKNKKTLAREAAEAAALKKRKRGRPLGSKNKKTLEKEAMEKAHSQVDQALNAPSEQGIKEKYSEPKKGDKTPSV